uniref:Uncharacterized protein n=1 Tax=Lactuca sativa TaxID=4236 RepID=A0A9R1W0P5_LACSA|nr:hypothetical protein LSAT_V11C300102810 [Lactuca sativa]
MGKFSLLIENEVNNFPTHVRFNHLKYMMDNFFNDEEEKKLMMMMMMKMLKAVRILNKEVWMEMYMMEVVKKVLMIREKMEYIMFKKQVELVSISK